MTGRRGLVAVVVAASVVGLVAYVWAARGSVHQAERRFAVDDRAPAAGVVIDLAEYAQAVRSDGVVTEALAEPTPGERGLTSARLRASVTATVDGTGARQHLVVRATAPSSEAAVGRLEAMTRALTAWDRRHAPLLQVEAARLEEAIRDLEEVVRTQQAIGGPAASDAIARALELRAELMARRSELTGRAVGGVLRPGPVVVEQLDGRPAERGILAGSLTALIGSCLLLASTVLFPRSTLSAASGRGLAVLAEFPAGGPHHEARFAEAAHELATRLLAATSVAERRVFVVTSPEKDEAATSIARALAEGVSRPDARTLLVDADLRSPSVARHYDLTQGYLTYDDREGANLVSSMLDWLLDPSAPHQVQHVDLGPRGRIEVVPQFMPAMSAGEVLRGGIALVAERWRSYDTVVVDAGPVLAFGDAIVLARHATVCVLVVDEERVGRGRLRAAQRALRRSGSAVVIALVTSTGSRMVATEHVPGPRSAPRFARRRARRDPVL